MSRVIIVSNRLPLKARIENEETQIISSEGGLATGLKTVHQQSETLWIGWPGIASEKVKTPDKREELNKIIRNEKCEPVWLSKGEITDYYAGFSNQVIWPLFHYFTEFCHFDEKSWDVYKSVNRKFADKILEHANSRDMVWIHDYHLMLIPGLVRRVYPDMKIGFFLHIPFPAYEVFKTLPVRREILNGLLGADLIGFHTFGYQQHFLSTVDALTSHKIYRNTILHQDHSTIIDVFPMGIDVNKFEKTAQNQQFMQQTKPSELRQEINREKERHPDMTFVLSIDRMDYTKGIDKRLKAFDYFLKNNPEYLGKVILIMLAVPSRTNVPQYQEIKREIDELVGRINGRYGTPCWNPFWYFYRSMPFENLIDLYTNCEIALLTPLRDGMNLVAKEYIMSRTDQTGVLILSEMAGASEEMGETLLINPNSFDEINNALVKALRMPMPEQKKINHQIQKRLRKNDIDHWASTFLCQLEHAEERQSDFWPAKLDDNLQASLLDDYSKARRRLFFLDYDGTLRDFVNDPAEALPDQELIDLIKRLADEKENQIVLISGRDEKTLNEWWGQLPVSIIAEHGNSISAAGPNFSERQNGTDDSWKDLVKPILKTFTERTPGTFIETKKNGMAWHYRKAEKYLGEQKGSQLSILLHELIDGRDLTVYHGNKVVEIVSTRYNKGTAVEHWLSQHPADFILAIGDDYTDEFMFSALPPSAYTIKVGQGHTRARYSVEGTQSVRQLLEKLNTEREASLPINQLIYKTFGGAKTGS